MSTAITSLPEAVGALTGSELIPIVQSGVTKRASASQISAISATATGVSFTPAGSISAVTVQGAIEELDSETLKTTDIGVTVQAYDATILVDADIGVNVQAYDATILKSADIGTTVQGYDATTLKSADIGVTVQGYDATTLKSADIGVTVQGYDADILVAGDIGSTVQGYDADTAKLDVIQTWSAAQTFGDGNLKLSGATSGTQVLKAAAIASTYTSTLPAVTGTLAAINFAQTWSADQTFTETTETTYSLSGTDIDPANGAVQYKTISGTTTFTADNFAAGQCVVLALTSGSSHSVTFPTATWVTSAGNTAPTLTAYDVVTFWKIGTTLYGAYVGSGA